MALAEDINQFLDKTDHDVGKHLCSLDVEPGTMEYELLQRRIINGSFAELGQFPYQAGLLIVVYNSSFQYNLKQCGGSLVTSTRVLTAAHCWYDTEYRGEILTVVLGSLNMNFGGIRIQSRHVVTHPYWNPHTIQHDIAVIYLPSAVPFSSTVAPIALPSGSELNEDFTGSMAISSGYGVILDGM
ncbi:hypothetical protein K1T71_008245 [Dendrolimus kikuchii]|uniref:Uncharacterized protein n=1 Tax=Dendrolimus kikuchii TaxID=765133 RepID=A0ACC1CWI7_9NEOP|nr:hypothetical protein K1T71_008245 [Dendrolimus kikuchii]